MHPGTVPAEAYMECSDMEEPMGVEWLADNQPAHLGAPAQEPVSHTWLGEVSFRGKASAWLEQWQLLCRKEALANADVAAAIANTDGLKEKERTSAGTAAESADTTSIRQLQQQWWSRVEAIRSSVAVVKQQLAAPQPGPAYVAGLTRCIEEADQLLDSFHAACTPAMQHLEQQARQLEEEIESTALRIEEELALQPSPSGQATATSRDPGVRVWDEARALQRPASVGRVSCQVKHRTTGMQSAAGRQSLGGSSGQHHSLQHRSGSAPGRRKTDSSSGSWDVPPRSQPMAAGARLQQGPTPPQGRLAPEVEAFDAFIKEHGQYGGWEQEDNEEFEHILKACAGDYTHAVKVAEERCVGFTRSELMQHARWHMDYMDLLVRKRMALAAWRARRDQTRAKSQAKAALLVPEPSQAPAAQATAEEAATDAAASAATREAEAAKQLVVAWKSRKADVQREAATRAAEAARQAAMQASIQLAERQHLNKMKLEVYKDIKHRQAREAAQKAAEAAERDRALKAMDINQAAAAIAERSSALVARRPQLVGQKQAAAQARAELQEQLLEKVHVEGSTDPTRVLRGTAAHMARVEQRRDTQPQRRDSAFILQMPQRLAQPSWRAGLNNDR